MKLPKLTAVAKAQLWGLLVGFALALLATERMGLSYGIFLIGGGAAWVFSERYLAPKLTGADLKTLALAIFTGMAFPWVGWLLAFGLQQLKP